MFDKPRIAEAEMLGAARMSRRGNPFEVKSPSKANLIRRHITE